MAQIENELNDPTYTLASSYKFLSLLYVDALVQIKANQKDITRTGYQVRPAASEYKFLSLSYVDGLGKMKANHT